MTSDLSKRLGRTQLDDNLNGNTVDDKSIDDETYPFDAYEYDGDRDVCEGEFEAYPNKMEQVRVYNNVDDVSPSCRH